jgi:signal transduction histidine kinase
VLAGHAQVAVHVEDTGPGIPEARQEHVFEPFVQLDRTLTQSHGGLGLGLAISRDLARGMGGDLVLDVTSESGARFILTLPRGSRAAEGSVTISGETRAAGRL